MSSTRNKNTSIDYKLQQRVNHRQIDNKLYQHSSYGRPTSEFIPAIGYTPSHMCREALANNSVDIESALYGIGSTNLVKPCEPVNPLLKNIAFKEFFDRRTDVIMPYPMVFNNNQRPFPL